MKKRTLGMFLLILMFILIGTANADFIVKSITVPLSVSEHIILISMGVLMVALAVFGRTRIKRHTS